MNDNLIAATINEYEVLRGDVVPRGGRFALWYYTDPGQICILTLDEIVELLQHVIRKKRLAIKSKGEEEGSYLHMEIKVIEDLIELIKAGGE